MIRLAHSLCEWRSRCCRERDWCEHIPAMYHRSLACGLSRKSMLFMRKKVQGDGLTSVSGAATPVKHRRGAGKEAVAGEDPVPLLLHDLCRVCDLVWQGKGLAGG